VVEKIGINVSIHAKNPTIILFIWTLPLIFTIMISYLNISLKVVNATILTKTVLKR